MCIYSVTKFIKLCVVEEMKKAEETSRTESRLISSAETGTDDVKS